MRTEPALYPPGTAVQHRPQTASARALLALMRPHQWTKNALVFAAPASAGVLFDSGVLLSCLWVAVSMCLVASAVYCINDAVDAEQDRLHPLKCRRPIASGAVSRRLAVVLAAGLLLGGLTLAAAAVSVQVAAVLALYVGFQGAYSFGAKRVTVVEMAIVASGFVLRTVAGGLAVDVPLSMAFVAVTGGAAMLVVSGKRLAELDRLGANAARHRAVLGRYSREFLSTCVLVFGVAVVADYALWAFGDPGARSATSGLVQASVVPFAVAIAGYARLARRGEGGEPDEVLRGHRVLQAVGLIWALLFLGGVSGA